MVVENAEVTSREISGCRGVGIVEGSAKYASPEKVACFFDMEADSAGRQNCSPPRGRPLRFTRLAFQRITCISDFGAKIACAMYGAP